MERRQFITGISAGIVSIPILASGSAPSGTQNNCALKEDQIQHSVIFDLKYEKGSVEAQKFISDGKRILTAIPGVHNFQVFAQISLKNNYSYGFSMVFENNEAYQGYNNHPDHAGFVENRWKKEVTRFLEIDYATI
jgi:hypothetical protein